MHVQGPGKKGNQIQKEQKNVYDTNKVEFYVYEHIYQEVKIVSMEHFNHRLLDLQNAEFQQFFYGCLLTRIIFTETPPPKFST